MLKHLPSALFALSLLAVVLNATLESGSLAVYGGAVITGTLAMAWIALRERKPKAPPPSTAEEALRLGQERDNLRRSLDSARQEGASDRIAFLEPKLAETERRLRKLETQG